MKVFKTDLSHVYVTHDTSSRLVVWDTNIGIRKEEGCVQFYSAAQYDDGSCEEGLLREYVDGTIAVAATFRRDFGCEPPPRGTAWLVNTTTGTWKRVDKDMYLVDSDSGEILPC